MKPVVGAAIIRDGRVLATAVEAVPDQFAGRAALRVESAGPGPVRPGGIHDVKAALTLPPGRGRIDVGGRGAGSVTRVSAADLVGVDDTIR